MRAHGAAWEAIGLLAVTLPLALTFNLPTLWLLAPLLLLALSKRPIEDYGLVWSGFGTPAFHLLVAGAVFVPYCAGHYLFAHWRYGADFELRLPPGFATQILDQFVGVALPEEFFFRGYLQTQLDRAWGTPWRVLGARVGAGWLVADALFAACHVFHGGPARLIVFFPGLLYGWLRARTDTIAVPVAYHAVSNLLMSVMLNSLR